MARLPFWLMVVSCLLLPCGCGNPTGSGSQSQQSGKNQTSTTTGQQAGPEQPDAAFKRLVAKKEEALKAKKIEYKNLKSSFEPASKAEPAKGTISFQLVYQGKTIDTPFEGEYEFKDGKWKSTPDLGEFEVAPPVVSTDEEFNKQAEEAQRTLREK
jgi:hypothetical protein